MENIKCVNIYDIQQSIEFDEKKQKIVGMMYSRDGDKLIPEDKLDFVRATDLSVERLFTPKKSNTLFM